MLQFFMCLFFPPFPVLFRECATSINMDTAVHAHITMFAINSLQLSHIYAIVKEMTFACYIRAVYYEY